MVKVRMNAAPAVDEVSAEATVPKSLDPKVVHFVIDSEGRKIGIKKLSLVERSRLLRAVGAENSANAEWMVYASIAASVVSINGDPERARTPMEIDALLGQLEEHGVQAIGPLIVRLYGGDSIDAEIDAAKK